MSMDGLRGSNKTTNPGFEREDCSICGIVFSKGGHRARHMLIHTGQKPHVCPFCGQRYQREDVLQRHITKVCQKPKDTLATMTVVSGQKRPRVRLACDCCHSKKLKCNGDSPCQKCTAKDLQCTYQRRRQRGSSSQSVDAFTDSVLTQPSRVTRSSQTVSQPGDRPALDEPTAVPPASVSSGTHADDLASTPSIPRYFDLHNTNLVSATPSDLAIQYSTDMSFQNQAVQEVPFSGNADLSQLQPFYSSCFPNGIDYVDSFGMFDTDLELTTWMGMDIIDVPTENGFFPWSLWPDSSLSNVVTSPVHERLRRAVLTCDKPPPSKQELLDSWIKRPFIARQYDIEVLEALIQVFLRHTEGTFASFQSFVISPHTIPAQLLAMAAAGALFSDCTGSATIAKLYYTDSQRMLTYNIVDANTDTLEGSTSILQTYIALEIFGLCSGHQRSNEISEAYHPALIQAMTDHQSWLGNCHSDTDRMPKLVFHDVLIVEAYRATMLQLQPILLPLHLQLVRNLVRTLESEDGPTLGSSAPGDTFYQQLAAISAISWFTAGQPEGAYSHLGGQFWRVETIEFYFQRFTNIRSSEFLTMPSARILIFTNLLALHAPLEWFVDIAYMFLEQGLVSFNDTTARLLRQWQQGDHYNLALMHANQVLETAETIVAKGSRHVEAPHDAICVYLATLIFAVISLARSVDLETQAELSMQANRGISLLTDFRVRISKAMKSILVSLGQRGSGKSQTSESRYGEKLT